MTKTKNKKAQTTIGMFVGIVLVFFIIIAFFIAGTVFVKVDEALDRNITLGNVNLAVINDQTVGAWSDTILNNLEFWGLASIFGMILGLFISAYFLRGRFSKLGIILDIFIIFAIFIFALYLRGAYLNLMDTLALIGETILEKEMFQTSRFMLNLPVFVVVIGAIMMLLFHSSIPRKREESSISRSRGLQAIGG